ncbi:MAG TPA: UTP--glucose-1-phosphate uridylyltransferase [Gaiellales bacterium]|jgi:UDP-N-acetylglucosamine/UDP-N-acetylgalactosamine diphosphorylase|nr:UTP--glucose-1-phosphate uridylyltransferase [Gaiellales bacterium]
MAANVADLRENLAAHGQEHLLRFWDALDEAGRARLDADVRAIDFDLLDALIESLVEQAEPDVAGGELEPAQVLAPEADDVELGRRALEAGEVAVVVVAGGQGTRLGFDGPKGCFPVGPVTDRTLFQIHAEKVAALGRRYGAMVPLYVMTSPQNHAEVEAFFDGHDSFGLDRVRLFTQGEMPAVDRETGRVLLAAPDRIALSPDGHGGVIRALARSGSLDEMAAAGVQTIFYLQVDNPLVAIGDPGFVGIHRRLGAEMSSKVVRKTDPAEKVGVLVEAGGRQRVIEYSDISPDAAGRRGADGNLELWAGSIALHVFEVAFAERLAAGGGRLPFHRAVKPVPYVDDAGRTIEPAEPNAVKFEQFIFDALPLAQRAVAVETDRRLEFEPLKNASGPSSPETVRARLSAIYADWLERAGIAVPRDARGEPAVPVEISPLVALDAGDLPGRVDPGIDVTAPVLVS